MQLVGAAVAAGVVLVGNRGQREKGKGREKMAMGAGAGDGMRREKKEL